MHIFQAISFFFCFLFFFSKKKRKWWAQMDSNHRPHAYQACALTTWAMRPYSRSLRPFSFYWWRLRESNPWPPACKAGALPAELNPHIRFWVTPFQGPQNRTISTQLVSITCSRRSTIFDVLSSAWLLRKEVIQPQVLLRLPCYDFTPITSFTFGGVLLAVRLPTSGPPGSHGVTGGVYKARERIHRGMLIHDY